MYFHTRVCALAKCLPPPQKKRNYLLALHLPPPPTLKILAPPLSMKGLNEVGETHCVAPQWIGQRCDVFHVRLCPASPLRPPIPLKLNWSWMVQCTREQVGTGRSLGAGRPFCCSFGSPSCASPGENMTSSECWIIQRLQSVGDYKEKIVSSDHNRIYGVIRRWEIMQCGLVTCPAFSAVLTCQWQVSHVPTNSCGMIYKVMIHSLTFTCFLAYAGKYNEFAWIDRCRYCVYVVWSSSKVGPEKRLMMLLDLKWN